MSHERLPRIADRRLWLKVAWTVALAVLADWLIAKPVLPRHKTLVLLLLAFTTFGLWLGPCMERWVLKGLATLMRLRRSSPGGTGEPPMELPKISADFVIGFQLTLVIALGATLFLDCSSVGEHLEQAGYAMSRYILSSHPKLPVIVIDTSDVARVALPDRAEAERAVRNAETVGSSKSPAAHQPDPAAHQPDPASVTPPLAPGQPVTDRAPLSCFLAGLALSRNKDSPPLVVGIDINFHNTNGRFLHPDDYKFFEFCLNLENKSLDNKAICDRWKTTDEVAGPTNAEPAKTAPLTIYLGVYQAEHLPPEQWLAVKDYASLAANMAVPREDQGHLYYELGTKGRNDQLPLLGAALVRSSPDYVLQEPGWPLTIFTEPENLKRGEFDASGKTFLVDYSWLKAIEDSKKSLNDFRSLADFRELEGKMVLLGDVEGAQIRDAFVVPGSKLAVPGVYLHACAAATLAVRPLYELRPLARDGADLVLAICVLVWLAWQRARAARSGRGLHQVAPPSAFGLVAAAVIVTSLLLVKLQVFWPDALIVALLLAIHPLAEWAWHIGSHAFFVSRFFDRGTPSQGATPL